MAHYNCPNEVVLMGYKNLCLDCKLVQYHQFRQKKMPFQNRKKGSNFAWVCYPNDNYPITLLY